MKKLLLAVIVSMSTLSTAALAEIKVGIILGFTGPIESLTPAMRDGARTVSYTHLTLPTTVIV